MTVGDPRPKIGQPNERKLVKVVFTAVTLLAATALTASGVLIATPAHATATPKATCSPTGASIGTSKGRILGTGSARCSFANIPEYLNVRVYHYYAALPDALAFYNQKKKPTTARTWSGTTKRCDNSTTAQYYAQAELAQYSGPKVNSSRKRLTSCAGSGA